MNLQKWNKLLFKHNVSASIRLASRLYDEHIHTTPFQKAILALGSSMIALMDPFRHGLSFYFSLYFCFLFKSILYIYFLKLDMVAVAGETLKPSAIESIKRKMESNSEGSLVLQEKPRINTTTANLDELRKCHSNSLGAQYVKFMEDNVG
jgi:ubiquinone biosynthesis protein COQ4 homolog, mitochondrial